MDVYWLEQVEADVPTADDWLSESEQERLLTMRFPKRRSDWRLGRWTAKCALAAYFGVGEQDLSEFEVLSRASGAPYPLFRSKTTPAHISLSHRSGRALCAVASQPIALGCDIELIEPRSDLFLKDYFTAEEQALVHHAVVEDRARVVTMLWSAKESASKALQAGLTIDTRSVVVTVGGDLPLQAAADDCLSNLWQQFRVSCETGEQFFGWYRWADSFVRTFVTDVPLGMPHCLSRAEFHGVPHSLKSRTWSTEAQPVPREEML